MAANADHIVFHCKGRPQPDAESQEMWRTDGTAANTVLLEDTFGRFYGQPVFLEDQFIFTVRTPDLGEELWTSDGTPGEAKLITEIESGPYDAHQTG
ncbi:MAG: hypothetical protein R3C44_14350 [Chloroflexota bacterium]